MTGFFVRVLGQVIVMYLMVGVIGVIIMVGVVVMRGCPIRACSSRGSKFVRMFVGKANKWLLESSRYTASQGYFQGRYVNGSE